MFERLLPNRDRALDVDSQNRLVLMLKGHPARHIPCVSQYQDLGQQSGGFLYPGPAELILVSCAKISQPRSLLVEIGPIRTTMTI